MYPTFNFRDFAINMLTNSSKSSNNPMAKDCLSIIQNGDDTKGEAMADNICKSYGLSREQALEKAKNFFGLG